MVLMEEHLQINPVLEDLDYYSILVVILNFMLLVVLLEQIDLVGLLWVGVG